MPQGSRIRWARATVASVGVTLCVGLLGCNSTPKTTTPTTPVAGQPTLPSTYGSSIPGSTVPGSTVPGSAPYGSSGARPATSALNSTPFPTTSPNSLSPSTATPTYPGTNAYPGNTGYQSPGGTGAAPAYSAPGSGYNLPGSTGMASPSSMGQSGLQSTGGVQPRQASTGLTTAGGYTNSPAGQNSSSVWGGSSPPYTGGDPGLAPPAAPIR